MRRVSSDFRGESPELTPHTSGLGGRAARAFGLSFVASLAARALSIAATFFLAQLLSPSDFGIASLGLLVVFVLLPITDIGFAQALVRAEHLEVARRAQTAFWLVILLSAALYGLCFLTADAFARLYGQPEIAPMLRVITLAVPIYGLSRIPSALLARGMQLGKQGLPEVLASVGFACVAIVLAYLHFGFWSIVVATVVRSAVQSAGVLMAAGWRPGWAFDAEVATELLAYARYLMAGAVLRLAYTNVDNAIVGKVLGMSALGLYSMAYNLGTLFSTHISPALGKVLFPTYARLLPDLPRARAAALLALRYASILISPITVAGIVVVPWLVPVLLGAKWSALSVSLQILLVYGWAGSVAPVHWALGLAANLNRASARINLITLTVALVAAYPIAVRFGFNGVAGLFTFVELIRLAMMAHLTRNHLGLGWRQQLGALLPGLVGSAVAGAALLALQQLWSPLNFGKMAGCLLVFAAVYATSLFLLGDLRTTQLKQLRGMLVRGRAKPSAPLDSNSPRPQSA